MENIIKKSELLELQNKGLKRPEIAKQYNVTLGEMNKYFKALDIKTKPKKALKYQVIDDTDLTS